jgi:chromosomal replication initiation ATPase DnaA
MNPSIKPGIIPTKLVISLCESEYNVSKLNVKSRKREIKDARQMAMFILHKLLSHSQAYTGHLFNRDHSTTFHACKTIHNLIQTEKETRLKFIHIAMRLNIPTDKISQICLS